MDDKPVQGEQRDDRQPESTPRRTVRKIVKIAWVVPAVIAAIAMRDETEARNQHTSGGR